MAINKSKTLSSLESKSGVAGNTLLLTSTGYVSIESLVNTTVNVWNGVEYKSAKVVRTEENSQVVRVNFNEVEFIDCGGNYTFLVEAITGKNELVVAKNLKRNDIISMVSLPRLDKHNDLVMANLKELSVYLTNSLYTTTTIHVEDLADAIAIKYLIHSIGVDCYIYDCVRHCSKPENTNYNYFLSLSSSNFNYLLELGLDKYIDGNKLEELNKVQTSSPLFFDTISSVEAFTGMISHMYSLEGEGITNVIYNSIITAI
jgi:hypothetical protein